MVESNAKMKSARRDISNANLKVINDYFKDNQLNVNKLIEDCVNLKLWDEVRPLAWRVFLGLLPTESIETWEILTHDLRYQYNILKEDIMTADVKAFIQSSARKGSPEYDSFSETLSKKDFALLSIIKLDLDRTLQDIPFFRQDEVKHAMINILYLYCKQNTRPGYQQGMNEILGALAYVFRPHILISEEVVGPPRSFLFFLIYLYDFFEPDLFFVFNELMSRGLNRLYAYNINKNYDSQLASIPLEERMEMTLADIVSSKDSELSKRIFKLFYCDFRAVNKKVFNVLALLVDPVIVLLRWILCLLNREFRIESIARLWDALLCYEFAEYSLKRNYKASGPFLVFVDYLALAMLCLLERKVMDDIDGVNLQSLIMHYPEDIPIERIIAKAIKIAKEMNNRKNFFKEKGKKSSLSGFFS